MINKIKILSLVILTTACAKDPHPDDPRTIQGVDPEFKLYVKNFEDSFGRSIGDVSIGFGALPSDRAGICTKFDDGFRQVTINPTIWGEIDDFARFNLIFHELGHCVLDRKHDDTMIEHSTGTGKKTVPKSFMYPNLFFKESISNLEDYYVGEMFNK